MGVARGLLTATLLFALIGVILVVIALATDNWKCFKVDQEAALGGQAVPQEGTEIYYTRSWGFFRECFYKDPIPEDINDRGVMNEAGTRLGLKKSPHGTKCVTAYPGFKYDAKEDMNRAAKEYVSLKITYIVLYSIGLFLAVVALLFMCIGIGLKKGIPVMCTGFIFLLAAIFLSASTGVWHKSNDQHMEFSNYRKDNQRGQPGEKYDGRNWYSRDNWDENVKNNTTEKFCWSYYLNWIGIGLIFLSAIASCCLVAAITTERKKSRQRKMEEQYGMQGGPVVGASAGGVSTQVYATGGNEKQMMGYGGGGGMAGGDPGYANYGYQPGYGYQPTYYDYLGYMNPYNIMQR